MKAGKLTVIFRDRKTRHFIRIYFSGFPFWEFGSAQGVKLLDLEDQDKVAAAVVISPKKPKPNPKRERFCSSSTIAAAALSDARLQRFHRITNKKRVRAENRTLLLFSRLTRLDAVKSKNYPSFLVSGEGSSMVGPSGSIPSGKLNFSALATVRNAGLHIICLTIRSVKSLAVGAARTSSDVSEVITITCSPISTAPASQAMSTAWMQRLMLPQKIFSAFPTMLKSCAKTPCC